MTTLNIGETDYMNGIQKKKPRTISKEIKGEL